MESPSSDAADMASSSPISSRVEGTSSTLARFPFLRFFQSPVSSVLEYSGFLRNRPDYPYSEARSIVRESIGRLRRSTEFTDEGDRSVISDHEAESDNSNGEVAIQIIGEQERFGGLNDANRNELDAEESITRPENVNRSLINGSNETINRETSPHQRYEFQQVAHWIEQLFPFSMLLILVLVRQHLQGFVIAVYITSFLFKSNNILRKQTALKGERKFSVLIGYSILFMLHIAGVYWWFRKDELPYALLMIPPKAIPPFWHAIFVILVNDTMVRQVAMVFKLFILMYYKNGRGNSFRKQGQMLTLVEYGLLLHRALLPAPIWYRFFLNKEYGSLFSSLVTGLYLTIKLTSVVEKVRSFVISLKALSRKDVQYGSYATSEQANAAGNLCAICQEKMRSPVVLHCKHIFCDDCVSEWFERERSCPLCRAFVRHGDIRSYGDGSTTFLLQLF